jgi:DNA-binding PadR family transcriptional regulator
MDYFVTRTADGVITVELVFDDGSPRAEFALSDEGAIELANALQDAVPLGIAP